MSSSTMISLTDDVGAGRSGGSMMEIVDSVVGGWSGLVWYGMV